MHDVLGQKLNVGDSVLVPAKIAHLDPTDNYCNCTLETVAGRRPDNAKDYIYAINTGTIIKVSG